MKSDSIAKLRVVLTTVCGVALATGVFAVRAQADQWDKKTYLTVNEPIQVQERLLQPGTYVLKLLDSSSNRHVVQIFNSDQSHIIDTVMAIPNYRLQPTGKSQFSFYETPAGTARALHAWFYPGDNFGQEFRYPKHNIVLQASAAITTAPSPSTVEAAPQPETSVAPTTQPAEPSAERAVVEESQPDNTPVEIAQAAPPPTPAPPPPAAIPQETPRQLPKTGSSYPLIGLIGLASLGLYSLVRFTRSA